MQISRLPQQTACCNECAVFSAVFHHDMIILDKGWRDGIMLTRMPVTHIVLLAPPTEHSSHSHHDSVPSLSSRIRAPHPPL